MQSWAQWLAEALGLPFTKLARDGARARDVLAEQVPRLAGPYDVACLYVGVNDARSVRLGRRRPTARPCARPPPRWPHAASGCCCARCPSDLGRPRAAPKPRAASAIVRAVARRARRRARRARRPRRPAWLLPRRRAPHRPRASSRSPTARPAPSARHASLLADRGPRLAARRARFAARWGVLLARDLRRRVVERVGAPRLAARQHEAELEHAVVADRDEPGHARRLDGEVGETDRRAADELEAPAGQPLATHGDGDRRAAAVQQ